MSADLSITNLVLDASPVVMAVMVLLLLASVVSWAAIFRKLRSFRQAQRGAAAFEARFWSGGNLSEIYTASEQPAEDTGGLERIFGAGFREFSRMRRNGAEPAAIVDTAQRGMRIALSRESERIETHLPFLATVGSTSPYVGLFGTVWGIMNAFLGLGARQQATLAAVAPGIAEALIATALGLFAAIPAVIAYNRFTHRAERLTNRYEIFIEEFTSILERHLHQAPGRGAEAAR